MHSNKQPLNSFFAIVSEEKILEFVVELVVDKGRRPAGKVEGKCSVCLAKLTRDRVFDIQFHRKKVFIFSLSINFAF